MNYINEGLLKSLEDLKEIRNKALDNYTIDERIEYNEFTDAEYVHNTTKIEGNRLGLSAVRKLFKEPSFRKCIWGVTEREFDEVMNYPEVLHYSRSCVSEINLYFIEELHKRIMKDIIEFPGEFRTHNNIYISGVDKILTSWDLIDKELQTIIDEYYYGIDDYDYHIKNSVHVFEKAALFHYKFESIHPFLDGNGRTGREIFNYMITSAGYPMMLFTGHRNYYLSLLQCGDEGLMDEMVNGFAKIMLRDYGMKC